MQKLEIKNRLFELNFSKFLSLKFLQNIFHYPEVLHHLSPDDLNDGGSEGKPQEDVDRADDHVETLVWLPQ